MTAPVTSEVVLAHHAILEAVPFLVPMMVITLMLVMMAVQDRRRGRDPRGRDLRGRDL